MRKRFKSKRKKNKLVIYLVLFIILSFFLINRFILKKVNNNIFKVNNKLLNIDRKKILLKTGLNFKETFVHVGANEDDLPVFIEVVKPKIFLYNTHNREEYISGNIMDATNLIKKKLENKVDVIYDNLDIVGMLPDRNLNYNDAYLLTKELVKNNLNESIELYIDFHRDALAHELSTTVIDGISYAKILFVIGAKHDNYKLNYEVCEKLNKLLKNYNSNLSRGILVREGARYNQELSGNVILIELGGNENTMEEITNTIDILVKVIEEYLYE